MRLLLCILSAARLFDPETQLCCAVFAVYVAEGYVFREVLRICRSPNCKMERCSDRRFVKKTSNRGFCLVNRIWMRDRDHGIRDAPLDRRQSCQSGSVFFYKTTQQKALGPEVSTEAWSGLSNVASSFHRLFR